MRELEILWNGMKFLSFVLLVYITIPATVAFSICYLLRGHPLILVSMAGGLLFLLLSFVVGAHTEG